MAGRRHTPIGSDVELEARIEAEAGGGGALPDGGTTGQTLAKTSEADGAAAWETPVGGTGVWKVYGVDSDNPGLSGGLTVGDGVMVAKWWTPGRIVAALETSPFLCSVFFKFTLGSTSAVTGTIGVGLPTAVDGTAFAVCVAGDPALVYPPLTAISQFASGGSHSTVVGLGDGVLSNWDDTHPAVWAPGDFFVVSGLLLASFYEPD